MFNSGLGAILKQVKSLQDNIEKVKQELEELRVSVNVGAGMIKVIANGHGSILSIKIDPQCIDKRDTGMLESMLVSAINEAKRKAEKKAQEHLKKFSSKIPISQILNDIAKSEEAPE